MLYFAESPIFYDSVCIKSNKGNLYVTPLFIACRLSEFK